MKEEMITLYESGKSFREISEICGVPMTSVWRKIKDDVVIKKHAYYGKKLRTYHIDENFFEQIDTKTKAYILGFLLADGHRCKNVKQIRLKLQEKDKEVLDKIKLAMNYDKPLNFEKRKNETHQNTYSLIICNSKICADLEKYGVVKNKTFEITYPNIDDIYFIDLFRGYFDGDGWLSFSENKTNLVLGVIGEGTFIKVIKQKLKTLYNIDSHTIHDKRHDSKILSLRIRKRDNVEKLYYLMYNNTDLFLTRKYTKFETLVR